MARPPCGEHYKRKKNTNEMREKTKILRTALLLLPAVALAGCIGEDYGVCEPERNVKFDFRLVGENGFTEHVSSVEAYIYDGSGNYLRSERIDSRGLATFEGMQLTLDPGEYRMVFWANMNGNTDVQGHDRGSGVVSHADHRYGAPGVVTVNGDRLWYGPSIPPAPSTRATRGIPQEHYALTIPEGGEFSDVIHFTHAHRSLAIWVKGLASPPTVDVEGLPGSMKHMGMEPLSGTVVGSHRTSTVEKNGTDYAATTFDTFYFEQLKGISIVLRGPAGTELYRIPLTEAIEMSRADPEARVLELMFTFLQGTVEVTIPSWSSSKPGFDL
jgi:hypothetical protein